MVVLLLLMAAGWEDSFIFRSTVIFLCYEKHLSGIFYLLTAKIKKATTAKETPT